LILTLPSLRKKKQKTKKQTRIKELGGPSIRWAGIKPLGCKFLELRGSISVILGWDFPRMEKK
jgi:hypothetical protein